eukprot:s1145_g8.t2
MISLDLKPELFLAQDLISPCDPLPLGLSRTVEDRSWISMAAEPPSGWALLWGGIKRSVTGYEYKPDKRHIDLKAVTAEFLGTLLLTFVGCGAATVHGAGTPITRLIIAFSFGMTVMAVAYAIGHHSGGHLNCAVTFSLVLGGAVSWNQGLANLVAQCFASIVACILLVIIHPCEDGSVHHRLKVMPPLFIAFVGL